MSAVPSLTASNTSKAGTSSPAANSLTERRPSLALVMRSASRCAVTPGPGEFFGQLVTMRQLMLSCARATWGAASAPAPASVPSPARFRNVRRLFCSVGDVMKTSFRLSVRDGSDRA